MPGSAAASVALTLVLPPKFASPASALNAPPAAFPTPVALGLSTTTCKVAAASWRHEAAEEPPFPVIARVFPCAAGVARAAETASKGAGSRAAAEWAAVSTAAFELAETPSDPASRVAVAAASFSTDVPAGGCGIAISAAAAFEPGAERFPFANATSRSAHELAFADAAATGAREALAASLSEFCARFTPALGSDGTPGLPPGRIKIGCTPALTETLRVSFEAVGAPIFATGLAGSAGAMPASLFVINFVAPATLAWTFEITAFTVAFSS
jgi:hypothetical protein